jgi:hydroxylamine reductase (hybrid-cluster protein)
MTSEYVKCTEQMKTQQHNVCCVCAAGAVVDAVKTGKLEHIFVIGGCDGSEPQRKYYDKLARLMPLNTMVSGCQQCGMCALLFVYMLFCRYGRCARRGYLDK